VRIEIMSVDQIEVPSAAELSAQNRQESGENGQWRRAHADLRQLQIAWTIDMQSIANLFARLLGKERIASEPSGGQRKPRRGCDDAGPDCTTLHQLAQAGFDKYSVLGPELARVQRRESQDLQLRCLIDLIDQASAV